MGNHPFSYGGIMRSKQKPNCVTICGIEVKRLGYLDFEDAFLACEDAIAAAADAVFPGMGVLEIAVMLKSDGQKDVIQQLLLSSTAFVRLVVSIIARFTKQDEDNILTSENIGIGGIVDLLVAVIEVNGIIDFFTKGLPMLQMIGQAIKQHKPSE
ncbi:hypothetical protein LJC42_01710 [Eubacteriales bacterium OttesenSCG-928-K08]|nr:hypothetical protein [Eubacteriales bacterium OttesenSCG-928-K08]